MVSGIVTRSSRHTDDQVRHERHDRRSSARSIARPTPMRETSTVNSVTCVMSTRWSCGSRLVPSASGSSPTPMPTATSTIGGESAMRWVR
jgi:hypothetical protein